MERKRALEFRFVLFMISRTRVIGVRAGDTSILSFLGNTLSAFGCWLCKSGLLLSAVYSSNTPTIENTAGITVIIH